MTTQTEPEDTSPRQMTCVRRLYVLIDEDQRTWLAAEAAPDDGPAEGGSMSHRFAGGTSDETAERPAGGSMSHLGPGATVEVEGDDPDQVTVVVPTRSGGEPQRLPAYRVSSALLPDGADPAVS